MRRRWKLLLAGGVAAGGLLWWASGGRPAGAEVEGEPPDQRPPLGPGDPLTVVTWNIHYGYGPVMYHGRGLDRAQVIANLESIARHLRAWRPDIVALQEVDRDALRSHGIDQLAWLREATGMPYAAWTETWNANWVPYPGPDPRHHIGQVRSGQAILSRLPLREARRVDLPQPRGKGVLYNRFYLHRALLDVRAELTGGGTLRLLNAHLEAYDPQNAAEHAAIATRTLSEGEQGLALLLGDMNTVPPEAAVLHGFPDEPEADHRGDQTLPTLRAIPGMREVVPVADYAADEAAWLTFPAHAPNRRLDYIFASDALRLAEVRVPKLDDPPSDHLPVVARFSLPGA